MVVAPCWVKPAASAEKAALKTIVKPVDDGDLDMPDIDDPTKKTVANITQSSAASPYVQPPPPSSGDDMMGMD